jgi:hypothetical protein
MSSRPETSQKHPRNIHPSPNCAFAHPTTLGTTTTYPILYPVRVSINTNININVVNINIKEPLLLLPFSPAAPHLPVTTVLGPSARRCPTGISLTVTTVLLCLHYQTVPSSTYNPPSATVLADLLCFWTPGIPSPPVQYHGVCPALASAVSKIKYRKCMIPSSSPLSPSSPLPSSPASGASRCSACSSLGAPCNRY